MLHDTQDEIMGDSLFQFDPLTPSTSTSSSPASTSLSHPLPTSPISTPVLDPGLVHGKARQKELPPTLPALDFEASDFYHTSENVSVSPGDSSTIGSSSYGSSTFAMSPLATRPGSLPSTSLHITDDTHYYRAPIHSLHRPRSLSNLSLHSPRSAAASSLLNTQSRLINVQSNRSKSLIGGLLSRRGKSVSAPNSPLAFSESFQRFPYNDVIDPTSSLHRSLSYPPTKGEQELFCNFALDGLYGYNLLGRNLFEELLPRELQLRIFASLVKLHITEHQHKIAVGKWTANKGSSSKYRWVGKDRGFRELVKLSRVCRSWRDMVFDGQLWATVDLRSFPALSPALIDTIMTRATSFVKQLNLSGNCTLQWEHFMALTDALSLSCDFPHTQLTEINLQGCKGLTTRALHYLLMRSPFLTNLCLKGQDSVNNVTCEIIASSCPDIQILNLSRCHDLDATGLKVLAESTMLRGDVLALRKLYLSGLRDVSDCVMTALGKATPDLEVLDLSYCDSLHNSSIEAFITVQDPQSHPRSRIVETVTLTAKEAGRDRHDSWKYTRRLTKLRHLILSSCPLLTDIVCANLAHAVPRLEILELAGIGDEIKDEGLIHLFQTTPLLRKLDLEDCGSITDAVLRFLTPADPLENHASSQVGARLEEIILSYAVEVSDEAILALIRGCPNLKVLETDNTGIGGPAVKEFIKIARSRDMDDARIVVTDCRGVSETTIKEMYPTTRGRLGWVGYQARKLKYLDGRDEGAAMDLKIGQDELDPKKVVLKSFHSWQTVDAVSRAREKRRKRRPGSSDSEDGDISGRSRWWTANGRRMSMPLRGSQNPNSAEGCLIM